MIIPQVAVSSSLVLILLAGASALLIRFYRNIYLHPLSKYPGPWYSSATSLSGAIISLRHVEPQWLFSLAKKYGSNTPIRISPTMLMFSMPSAIKDIYWDPTCNTKWGLYGSGTLGPPSLFTTLDGEVHKALRKALGGPQWSIGSLKNHWEDRIDDQISVFAQNLTEKAERQEQVVICDKVAEFAADIMGMVCFTQPWGFLKNDRDERNMLGSFCQGLEFFGLVGRFRFLREEILTLPKIGEWLLPSTSDESGMGWLMAQADREVPRREEEMQQGIQRDDRDFLQYCLDAAIDGRPLDPIQRRAHITILIQAGADTTGTALGSTLRFLLTHPKIQARALLEIHEADAAGLLSTPIKYEETRIHLPYFVACIKESIRIHPPATNLFGRVAPKEGKEIDGFSVPPGTEITSNAYVVQRDPELYAPDPEAFRPERWLKSVEKANEMEAASFVFSVGPRVCLGKDIAIMELYKVLPEMMRRFEFELVREGTYFVAGGIAYNKNFTVKVKVRE